MDGDWNGHRPFQYDLSDPLGHKIANKLLPTYLATRRGNCVSMPVLFIILADRLGLPVTASTAPQHIFAKFRDDSTGKMMNIEATSGGLPARDAWYRENMPMSDAAVKNGVYLKTLSRKETAAVMAEIVVEHFMATKRYRDVIAVSDLIIKQNASFVDPILSRGSAYGTLIETEFRRSIRHQGTFLRHCYQPIVPTKSRTALHSRRRKPWVGARRTERLRRLQHQTIE